MRDIYIINPKAGKRDTAVHFMERAKAYHKEHGGEFELHLTQRAGHGEEIARTAAESGGEIRIWAVGGDGTLLEVVRAAANFENVTVGVFPCGTGNDFIRSFGSKEVFLNFDRQRNGKTVVLDMIHTEHGDAVNICSLGFDARVADGVEYYKHLPGVSGEMAYILSLTKTFFSKLTEPMTITIWDEHGEEKTYTGDFMLVLAGNGRWYGGGFCGAPKAVLNDGLLDFVFVRHPSYLQIPFFIGEYKKGKHIDDKRLENLLTFVRGTKIHIESSAQMVSNMDGYCIHTQEETFSVMPGALRFILPEGISLPQRGE